MENETERFDGAYLRLFRQARPFRVWLMAVGALVLLEAVAVAIIVGISVGVFHQRPPRSAVPFAPGVWIGVTFVALCALTFVPPVVACWRVDPELRRTVLFGTLNRGEAVVLAGCTSIVAFALLQLVHVAQHRFPVPPRTTPSAPAIVAVLALFVSMALLFAPIVEELVMQGWLQTRLDRLVRPWPSAVLTTLIFAALHLATAPVMVLPLGTFAILRLRTKSLGACMMAHLFYNALVLFAVAVRRS